MTDERDILMVCVRKTDEPDPIQGSLVRLCDKCGEQIYFDPTSMTAIPGRSCAVTLICMQCYGPTEPVRIITPSGEQIEKVLKHLAGQKARQN